MWPAKRALAGVFGFVRENFNIPKLDICATDEVLSTMLASLTAWIQSAGGSVFSVGLFVLLVKRNETIEDWFQSRFDWILSAKRLRCPMQVGDFAILLRAGFDRWSAARMQLSTALVGVLGACFALCTCSPQGTGEWVETGFSGSPVDATDDRFLSASRIRHRLDPALYFRRLPLHRLGQRGARPAGGVQFKVFYTQ